MNGRRSFIGGMNVPARGLGRVNATFPLAELSIEDEWLTLRPRLFAAWLTGPFRVPLREISRAFPVRGRLGSPGVGVRTTDGLTAYFWTRANREAVLAELHARGVPVDRAESPASAQWSLRSPKATVTEPATLAPLVTRLYPVSLVLGTAFLIGLETQIQSTVFRIWMLVVWMFGVVNGFRLWRSTRPRP